MNGYEASKEIIALNPTQKVLLISPCDTAENLHRRVNTKASGQISDECSLEELQTAI